MSESPFDSYRPRFTPSVEEIGQWIREHITLLPASTDLKTSEHIRDEE